MVSLSELTAELYNLNGISNLNNSMTHVEYSLHVRVCFYVLIPLMTTEHFPFYLHGKHHTIMPVTGFSVCFMSRLH